MLYGETPAMAGAMAFDVTIVMIVGKACCIPKLFIKMVKNIPVEPVKIVPGAYPDKSILIL